MKKVYAVGVLQLDASPNARHLFKARHLAGLYAHFEEAEQAILENRGDFFEYYYNYALIEETYVIDSQDQPGPGEIPWPPREWWYFADYTINTPDKKTGWSEPVISKCEKPSVVHNVVHFWSG